jgi:hypothetical protein
VTEKRPQTESELVSLIRAIDVSAPPHVHERVQALLAERGGAGARRPSAGFPGGWRVLAPSLAAVAAAVVAVVLAVGGGAAGPTLQQASALTLAAPTEAAPREDPVHRAQLRAAMDGVAFPYWGERFGWRAVGARSDRLAGRQVMTVFYEEARGRRVGYAIVAGSAPAIHGGTVSMRQGTPFRVISNAAATEVAWLRHGHLCIVSGRGVSPNTLLALASWKEDSNSA